MSASVQTLQVQTEGLPPSAFQKIVGAFSLQHRPLPDKPEETAENTVRALWLAAAAQPTAIGHRTNQPLPKLTAPQHQKLEALLKKRLRGIPLAHLIGRQLFMGIEFLTDKNALIPRRETEILGKTALQRIRSVVAHKSSATVIDVCTGSGNLALSFAHYEPQCTVHASDFSAEAIAVAQNNAAHLGLNHRVGFRAGDMLSPFDEPTFHAKVDIISCNPPYISSNKLRSLPSEIIDHEPVMAFNGGPLGVNIILKLVKEATQLLTPGGWLCLEVGEGQGPGITRLLGKNPHFSRVDAAHDDRGTTRAVAAQRV